MRAYLVLMALLTGPVVLAQELKVVIHQVKDDQGDLMVAIYNSENSFARKDNPWKGEIRKAAKGTVTIGFRDIPPGEYVVSVIHDANSNRKLDTNFLGIPREGFGFSNDAMGSWGPPRYRDAKVKWTGTEVFTLNLRYIR